MNIKRTLAFILCFYQFFAFGQIDRVQAVVNEINSSPDFANAIVSFEVYDTDSNKVLLAQNNKVSLASASVTKLFSTAAAMSVLGDKTLETRFYVDGELKDSILYGNLWIRGGGDPALGSRFDPKNDGQTDRSFLSSWVDSIQKYGIKEIRGAIIGDASDFGYKGCPDGWSWSDIGNAYGAYPGGLAIFDNVVTFRLKMGAPGTPSELVKTMPFVPGMEFHNYITAGNITGDDSYIYGAPYQNDRIGTGTMQKYVTINTRGSLPNPEAQVAYEFYKSLTQRGILVDDSVSTARELMYQNSLYEDRFADTNLLFTYHGTSLFDIVHWTNKRSVNMFAEQMVCLLGYYYNGDGSHENGMRRLHAFWNNKIPTDGLFLRDGSGLSRSDGITTEQLCGVLNYMQKSKYYQPFYESLPIAGVDGTLSHVCRNQAAMRKVHAKSGSMQRIRSYAGYAVTNSGRHLTFAIVLNNFSCSSYKATLKLQKFMNSLVTL